MPTACRNFHLSICWSCCKVRHTWVRHDVDSRPLCGAFASSLLLMPCSLVGALAAFVLASKEVYHTCVCLQELYRTCVCIPAVIPVCDLSAVHARCEPSNKQRMPSTVCNALTSACQVYLRCIRVLMSPIAAAP